MALEVGAEHAAGFLGGALGRVDQHHTAALAAATDLHLDLHDALAAQFAGGLGRLLPRGGDDPARRGDALGAEQLLALMLVQIHGAPCE